MKKDSHTFSKVVQTFNLWNEFDRDLFELQIRRFFSEMRAIAERWQRPQDGKGASLRALDQTLYDIYGLTSQALRHLARIEETENWHRSKIIELAQALAIVHLEACDGKLNLDATDFQGLFQTDRFLGLLLAVSAHPEARNLKAFDNAGWIELLAKSSPGLRLVAESKVESMTPLHLEIKLTESQKELAHVLDSFWALKRSGRRVAGYDPRPIPLIVGPSGSGKSALVRYFAQSKSLAIRDYNVGTWLIHGAKAEPISLQDIGRFVDENDKGVIFLDEVDKLDGTSDWIRNIQQEVFALLDGRTDSFVHWTDQTRAKFAHNFLIIGAGTWQTLYQRNGKTLGFQSDPQTDWAIDLSTQTAIPEELIMRFNADVLFLRPLGLEELSHRIAAVVEDAGFGEIAPDRLQALAAKAYASQRHNRWLEAYSSRLLRRHPEACR